MKNSGNKVRNRRHRRSECTGRPLNGRMPQPGFSETGSAYVINFVVFLNDGDAKLVVPRLNENLSTFLFWFVIF